MVFKVKSKKPLSNGDRKVVSKYLWIPFQIRDEIRWMCKADIEYVVMMTDDFYDGWKNRWVAERFV